MAMNIMVAFTTLAYQVTVILFCWECSSWVGWVWVSCPSEKGIARTFDRQMIVLLVSRHDVIGRSNQREEATIIYWFSWFLCGIKSEQPFFGCCFWVSRGHFLQLGRIQVAYPMPSALCKVSSFAVCRRLVRKTELVVVLHPPPLRRNSSMSNWTCTVVSHVRGTKCQC